jgi:hypothetical protein
MFFFSRRQAFFYFLAGVLSLAFIVPPEALALASNNIPLESPVYYYLDKLAAFGFITSDFKGIRPITKAEAARLLLEAEKKIAEDKERAGGEEDQDYYPTVWDSPGTESLTGGGVLAGGMVRELRHYLEREITLRDESESAPLFDVIPLSTFRDRYVNVDGVPRSYERPVHDEGGDGVFGIGSGLRPVTPFPAGVVQQHGSEGTPLMENNEGVIYREGSNVDLRFSSEAFAGRYLSALVEPMFLYSKNDDSQQGRLNKGYAKLGGGGLELEVGRDENWLGLEEEGNLILTNNAANLDFVKLSSPEPVNAWIFGKLKYDIIFSRYDKYVNVTTGVVRQPFFLAMKVSLKPAPNVELGLNTAREVGGPGVSNSFDSYIHGIFGGTNSDNTKNMGGIELRWRIPYLRYTEVYGEFVGSDSAAVWPICDSYEAGIFIPRLTADGRNDFRLEYFIAHPILYTSSTFPEGDIYQGLPLGNSQGGASEQFFARYRHWFTARNYLALDYIHIERGNMGRVPVNSSGQLDLKGVMQAVERTNAGRISWHIPIYKSIDAAFMYGWERVNNMNLVGGVQQTDQIMTTDFSYRF